MNTENYKSKFCITVFPEFFHKLYTALLNKTKPCC